MSVKGTDVKLNKMKTKLFIITLVFALSVVSTNYMYAQSVETPKKDICVDVAIETWAGSNLTADFGKPGQLTAEVR